MSYTDYTQYSLDPLGRPRFFGVYKGIVVNVQDSSNRAQICVPQITGDDYLNWAEPSIVSGTESSRPLEGDTVWVSFESGDPSYPVWFTNSQGDPGIVATNDGNPPNSYSTLWLDETATASYPTGPAGATGNTPVLSVTTTPTSSNIANVTISGPAETPTLNFQLPSYLNYLTPAGSFDIYPRYMLNSSSIGARTKGYIPFATFIPNSSLSLTTSSKITFFIGGTPTQVGTATGFVTRAVILSTNVAPENATGYGSSSPLWTVVARTVNIGALTTANQAYSATLDASVNLVAGNLYAIGILQTCTVGNPIGGATASFASPGGISMTSTLYTTSTLVGPMMAGQYQSNSFLSDIAVGATLKDGTSSGMDKIIWARITV